MLAGVIFMFSSHHHTYFSNAYTICTCLNLLVCLETCFQNPHVWGRGPDSKGLTQKEAEPGTKRPGDSAPTERCHVGWQATGPNHIAF